MFRTHHRPTRYPHPRTWVEILTLHHLYTESMKNKRGAFGAEMKPNGSIIWDEVQLSPGLTESSNAKLIPCPQLLLIASGRKASGGGSEAALLLRL